MKTGIHPDYVVTEVTCSCGNTFTTRSTAKSGHLHADVCSACHPFYTGKQKIMDVGGRVDRFEKRYGKRVRSTQLLAFSSARSQTTSSGLRALSHVATASGGRRQDMTDQADPDGILATLAAEHNEVERALADPAVHADQARARTLGRRYAELSPIMAAAAEVDRLRGDLHTALELAAEDESFADEVTSSAGPARRRGSETARAAAAQRSQRQQGRHSRDQGRRGR